MNVHTLFTPGDKNLLKEDVSTVPVWVKLYGVPVTAFSNDGLSAIATKLGTPLMLHSFTSDMYMRSSCKVFRHIHEECPKNTSAGEKKIIKKPSQASRGVLVGLKMAFKSQKEYRPVTKKPNNSSSSNKKKGVEPTIEVSNSNPFDVLNSVDNDVEFGTNGGTSNLGNNVATPSGFSFMNIDNDGEFASNTPIGEKIDKIERQISEGKLKLLDNDENPLVPMGIVESDSEVEVLYDETANLMIPTSGNDRSDKGYEQYNLAYFFVKRIECARATPTANLPYGMFLTRLYRHVMEHYPHLDNGIYNVVDRVMRDDDEDDGASRASTPSPTTYLNSLPPLNYQ
ncbi:ARID DNA-binding domain-containing protein [Tanacetum coccineum]